MRVWCAAPDPAEHCGQASALRMRRGALQRSKFQTLNIRFTPNSDQSAAQQKSTIIKPARRLAKDFAIEPS